MRYFAALIITILLSTPIIASEKKRIVYVMEVWLERDQCRVAIEGEEVSKEQLPHRLRQLPDRSAEIHVKAKPDTPYRCVGGAIYHAQEAGFVRIGFVTHGALADLASRR